MASPDARDALRALQRADGNAQCADCDDEEPAVGERVARRVRVLGVLGRAQIAGRARELRAIGVDGFVERGAAGEDAGGRERRVERVLGATRRAETDGDKGKV